MAGKEEIAVSDLPPALAALGALLARLDALHGRERVAAAAGPALAEAAAAAAARAEAASVAAALDDATEGEAAEAQRAAEEAAAAARANVRLRGGLSAATQALEVEIAGGFPNASDAFAAWAGERAAARHGVYTRAAEALMREVRVVAAWRALLGAPLAPDAVKVPTDPGNIYAGRYDIHAPELAPASPDLLAAIDAASTLDAARRVLDRVERRAA